MIHPEAVAGDEASQLAAEAMAAVDRDPRLGLPLAEAALLAAVRSGNGYAASTAERAWGHALIHVGALDEAARHLTRAAAWGRRAEAPEQTAEARSKLAFTRLQQGRPTVALREIDAALPDLTGIAAGRARAQRAIVLHVIGRLDEALVDFDAALRVLRRQHDLLGQQRLLINRALVHADRFDFAAGERDLSEAETLARRLERPLTLGLIANNRALMLTVSGDVPAALAELDRAEAIIGRHGAQLGTLYQDRAQLLLSVGLTEEAASAAAEAGAAYAREGRALKVPEVRLLQAESALLAGQPELAAADAASALRQFAAQRRPEWTQLARLLRLRAERVAGVAPASVAGRTGTDDRGPDLGRLARRGARRGDRGRSTDGRPFDGRAPMGPRATGGCDRPVGLARISAGPRPGVVRPGVAGRRRRIRPSALAAARRGLTILDGHAATLGASELRVHAAAHRADLVSVGLDLAFATGRPRPAVRVVGTGPGQSAAGCAGPAASRSDAPIPVGRAQGGDPRGGRPDPTGRGPGGAPGPDRTAGPQPESAIAGRPYAGDSAGRCRGGRGRAGIAGPAGLPAAPRCRARADGGRRTGPGADDGRAGRDRRSDRAGHLRLPPTGPTRATDRPGRRAAHRCRDPARRPAADRTARTHRPRTGDRADRGAAQPALVAAAVVFGAIGDGGAVGDALAARRAAGDPGSGSRWSPSPDPDCRPRPRRPSRWPRCTAGPR